MNKISKKITMISNILLAVIICFVAIISFSPQRIVPIYNRNEVKAIYNGNRQNKNISLMINVYENAEVVNKMIDLFLEKKVNATFFVGGCWADDNEKTLQNIVNNGFEIANHGYYHRDHAKLSFENNVMEISNTEKIIEALCDYKTKLFAPPSGSFSVNTLDASSKLNYQVIMWSKDTIDWRDSDTDLIYNRATKNPQNGDLILMHPKTHTLKILPKIIDFYLNKGYSLVCVSDNLA